MTNATLKIYPNMDKISKKSNSIPIYFRIIVNGKKAEGRIPNIMLELKDVNLWNPILGMLNDPKAKINDSIEKLRTNFKGIIANNLYDDNSFTSEEIRDLLSQKKSLKIKIDYVLEHFENFYKTNVKDSNHWSKSTKKIFNKSLNHYIKFLKYKSLQKLEFKKVDLEHGQLFFDYLTSNILDEENKVIKNAVCNATASQIIKKIKSIYKKVVRVNKNYINPFEDLKISFEHKKKQKLNISELKKMYDYDLSSNSSLELCRDLFLFQAFTGFAYIDMVGIRQNQVIETTSKDYTIVYHRQKTAIEGQIILNKYALALIKKYKSHPYVIIQGGIMPKINLQKYNSRLKLLSIFFNLSIPNLSTHYARHCFFQFLKEGKVGSAEVKKTFMGWTTRGTMESVYGEVTEEELVNANIVFEQYLDKHLNSSENN